MKSLSKVKIADLALLYSTLEQVCVEHADVWTTLSQQDVFELVTKKCKKKINPTLIQKEVERLETFELPRNVSDSHNNRPGADREEFDEWFKGLEIGLSVDAIQTLHLMREIYWHGWQGKCKVAANEK